MSLYRCLVFPSTTLVSLLLASACGSGVNPSPGGGSEIPGPGADGGSSQGSNGGPSGGSGTTDCSSTLKLTLRDFTEAHPDFQSYLGSRKGLVKATLGSDRKPVYAPDGGTNVTTGGEAFDQWYRDVEGVNMRVSVPIEFTDEGDGQYLYDNSNFFPLNGMGFGNGPPADRNFLFTTEAHTKFTYAGGEVFTFRGDDDLWIFINDKLVIDLGGVHAVENQTIHLDDLAAEIGITQGQTYAMDIFHAERHTSHSNFRIETTIDLSCIENVDVTLI